MKENVHCQSQSDDSLLVSCYKLCMLQYHRLADLQSLYIPADSELSIVGSELVIPD